MEVNRHAHPCAAYQERPIRAAVREARPGTRAAEIGSSGALGPSGVDAPLPRPDGDGSSGPGREWTLPCCPSSSSVRSSCVAALEDHHVMQRQYAEDVVVTAWERSGYRHGLRSHRYRWRACRSGHQRRALDLGGLFGLAHPGLDVLPRSITPQTTP